LQGAKKFQPDFMNLIKKDFMITTKELQVDWQKDLKNESKRVNFLSDLKKEYITNLLLILNSFLEYGLNSKLKNR
jgi:hypothetical protein